MKQIRFIYAIVFVFLLMLFITKSKAQQPINILDQNITLYVENEPLESVIEKICTQFNLDYNYNSKLIKGKRVNLSISNKSVREVLNKLMQDYFLIFEIENNLMMVRDYIPMAESINYNDLYLKPNTGFLFNNTQKKSIETDFRLISNLIIIQVSINNSDTMNFILDTGVKTPIITELTLIDKLDLNYLQPVAVNGLGKESNIQAYQSGDNTLTLPGLTARHVKMNVILDETFQISQILGMPVHGLIGFDFFRHYIVKIDYVNKKIELTKPQFFTYKPRKNDIVLPIKMIQNKPVIETEIVQDNGTIVPVNLLVDTGASDALWLITEADSQIVLPEKNLFTYLGAGLGGDLYGYKGRLGALWLGGKPIENPIVSYPKSDFINQIILSENRHGSIGGELLRRFTVTIDYHNLRLILKPNSNFKNNYNYNMSGLEVINPVPGVPVFIVSNVIEGSPAWEAGVRETDQILRLNFTNHNKLTLNNINLELRLKDNKRIRLLLLRNGKELKTEFRLKKIL